MKTLIVYYSLEGNTEYVAERIAEKIGADLLRLVPVKPYSKKGLAKFIHGGKSARTAEKPKLEDYDADLAMYDRVVLGFPVWAGTFAPPMGTFAAQNRGRLKRMDVVAFACQGGRGAEKALAKLKKAIGIEQFEVEAVFSDPKKKPSSEKDAMIDTFCSVLAEQEEEEEAAREEAKREQLEEALDAFAAKPEAGKAAAALAVVKIAAVYLPMIAFDMTVAYVICKKLLDKADAMREE